MKIPTIQEVWHIRKAVYHLREALNHLIWANRGTTPTHYKIAACWRTLKNLSEKW